MYKLILHGKEFSDLELGEIETAFDSQLHKTKSAYQINLTSNLDSYQIQQWRDSLNCDVNILPVNFDSHQVRLVISDMDSTFINIECVDEIADYAGVKEKVSQVTEAAMRGELNFEESLKERVSLLKGLDESALQKVYDDRLKLNPGAEQMLDVLKANEIKFALVSGGFTFFTSRLKEKYSLDYALSNTLEVKNGQLTGKVLGNIVGAEAKASFLLEKCKELDITPQQVVAIGDGANDLKMMAESGLGIAYKAKPKVQADADCAINVSGLDGLLGLLDL